MNLKSLRNGCLLLVITLTGCDLFQIKQNNAEVEVESTPLARVYETYLYPEDVTGIISGNVSEADSTFIIEKYIDQWIKQQLLIAEAKEKINIDEAQLDRRIQELRYELMVYEYQKYYLNRELDPDVSDEEVEEYYQANLDNFILKQNIIKGTFIKVPREAPNISSLKRLIRSDRPNDKEELKSYCYRFASTYYLEDTVWINFDEVIANTPLVGIPNKVQYLRNNRYVETSDDNNLYFLRIKEYKISDQNSPVEFVADQIRAIIRNKRKLALTEQLEEEIYKNAIRNNDFEIYQ